MDDDLVKAFQRVERGFFRIETQLNSLAIGLLIAFGLVLWRVW